MTSGISAERTYQDRDAHEDKRRIEIFVVFLHIVSVKLIGFLPVDGKEVGAWIIGPEWLEEFLEGRMEAILVGR